MRKVVSYVQSLTQHSPPPPNSKSVSGLWADLPQVNRRQLLWLLSHLLERQLEPDLIADKEDEDELDDSIE